MGLAPMHLRQYGDPRYVCMRLPPRLERFPDQVPYTPDLFFSTTGFSRHRFPRRHETRPLRLERSQVGRDRQHVVFTQILNDWPHQLGSRAVARIVLDIIELACQIAGRTARQGGEIAIAFQTLTMAGGARDALTGAAFNDQVLAFLD